MERGKGLVRTCLPEGILGRVDEFGYSGSLERKGVEAMSSM